MTKFYIAFVKNTKYLTKKVGVKNKLMFKCMFHLNWVFFPEISKKKQCDAYLCSVVVVRKHVPQNTRIANDKPGIL